MPRSSQRRRDGVRNGLLALAAILAAHVVIGHGQIPGRDSGQVFPPVPGPPRDPARELAMKIKGPFTLASVGDVMIKRPASMRQEPPFQGVLQLLRDADIAFGNMEGNLGDIPRFDGPLRGMMGSKDVAADLKAMGFDLMNRANNHVFDAETEGLFSTIQQLDEAGIVHAGTGKNLEDARAPAFLDTPKGRVALIGIHTPHTANARPATVQVGNIGGRPGLNALNLTTYHIVNREQFEGLRKLRAAVFTPPPGTTNTVALPTKEPADRVQLFGVWYKLGATPGTKSYEMSPDDLGGILRSIRNGKYLANFLIATIHAHQGPVVAQQWLFEDQTPDFLIELAHQAIDNGADAFVGHGPHVLRGIEIYKGKPIFYGMGEFFYQWQHMDATLMSGSWTGALREGQTSDVERSLSENWRAVNFESVVALSRFDNGELAEIRLHPTEGGFAGPVAELGMPRLANAEAARRILTRLQALSKPFGTTISIEDGNVGVIRLASRTSSAGR